MSKTRLTQWIACSDTHGDLLDPAASAAFAEFVKHWKPNLRLHLGDVFDFRSIRKKATDEERREGLRADIDAGCEFLRWYRPNVILWGNHDQRLYDLLDVTDHKLGEYARMLIDEIEEATGDAQCLPYHKRRGVYRLSRTTVCIHGYNSGIHAARNAAMVYGDMLMGHVHRVDQQTIPGVMPRHGRAIGCLCRLDLDYNRAHRRRWRSGTAGRTEFLRGEARRRCGWRARPAASGFFPRRCGMSADNDAAVAIIELLGKSVPRGEGLTINEIADEIKLSRRHVACIVAAAIKAGRMRYAGKREARRVDGSAYWVPVYCVTEKSPKCGGQTAKRRTNTV